MSKAPTGERWVRVAAWFLAISYGLGAPLTAFLQYRDHIFSERFNLSPWLVYFTCAVQLACSIGVLLRPFARWAAAALTLTTLGAIAAHLRIGSPQTAVAAAVYTAIQIWFGAKSHIGKAGDEAPVDRLS